MPFGDRIILPHHSGGEDTKIPVNDSVQALSAGDLLLDRFRIGRVFTGGMGLLWAVTDAHTGRRYAIKTVRPEHARDEATRAAFRAEALTWIALDHHEHLVQALWLIEAEPAPFLVLEYVDGSDLQALLAADGALPTERAVDLALQFAAGMAYAHGKPIAGGVGVVHRDLKPSNVLVRHDGVLKVTDFGLARIFKSGGGAGAGGEVGGTPAYMAPEPLRGEPLDGRADIYSFGLVLYEMLAGFNPLAADTLPEQLIRIRDETPPPLLDVPPDLAALIARCVEKDAARRPHDFHEVTAHLAVVARDLDGSSLPGRSWRIAPQDVPLPQKPAGVVVSVPDIRPRQPKAGEPFFVDVVVSGDVGRGPVEAEWRLTMPPGVTMLTPPEGRRVRIEAGGRVQLRARVSLVAEREGAFSFDAGVWLVRGPETEAEYPVAAFQADVLFAFLLPWVARDDEAALIDTMLKARTGAAVFYGGTGFGKSRLLLETERRAARMDLPVVRSRAHDGPLRPMRVLNDLARALFQIPSGDVRGIRAAIHRLLGDDLPTARYFAEVLLGGVSLENETPLAHRWFALLKAAAAQGPLVVLLDDLHLADERALQVILELAARTSHAELPVVLICTAGSSDRRALATTRLAALHAGCAHWARRGIRIEERELRSLDAGDVTALFDAVFLENGFAEEAPWFAATIHGVTDGNPFHVTEILHTLRAEPGAVECRDGEWRLLSDLSEERLRALVPAALDVAVRRRLDELTPETRAVMEQAAVLGEEFDAGVLRHALGDGPTVDAALFEMERTGVTSLVSVEIERHRFFSAIVPTAVERALEPARARALHRAAAEGILSVYGREGLASRSLGVAAHMRAAGLPRRSLPYTLAGCERLLSLDLGERARRLLANARPLAEQTPADSVLHIHFLYLFGLACEASGYYDEGRDSLERFLAAPQALTTQPRAQPRALVRLGRIHQAQGDFESAVRCFTRARDLYDELGDRRKLAFVYASLGNLALTRGEYVAAEGAIGTAAKLAAETGNEGAAIEALSLKGKFAFLVHRPLEARLAFAEAEERSRELGDRRRQSDALEGLGRVALEGGYMDEARRWIRAAIERHGTVGDRPALARNLLHLGDIARRTGAAPRALQQYRRARRVFADVGRPDGVATARQRAGLVLAAAGDTTRSIEELAAAAEGFGTLGLPERFAALRDLGRALADAGSERSARLALARADRGEPAGPGRRRHRVGSRARRARLALRRGDLARARYWARRALHTSVWTTGPGARITANLVEAEVALRQGDDAGARRAAETALAFARELGNPLRAAAAEHVLLELAGRAGLPAEIMDRAHRAARAYTDRRDVRDAPARLLLSLARAWEQAEPARAERYRDRARSCYRRLESRGFLPPDDGPGGGGGSV